MVCPNCKSMLPENVNFCTNCGMMLNIPNSNPQDMKKSWNTSQNKSEIGAFSTDNQSFQQNNPNYSSQFAGGPSNNAKPQTNGKKMGCGILCVVIIVCILLIEGIGKLLFSSSNNSNNRSAENSNIRLYKGSYTFAKEEGKKQYGIMGTVKKGKKDTLKLTMTAFVSDEDPIEGTVYTDFDIDTPLTKNRDGTYSGSIEKKMI